MMQPIFLAAPPASQPLMAAPRPQAQQPPPVPMLPSQQAGGSPRMFVRPAAPDEPAPPPRPQRKPMRMPSPDQLGVHVPAGPLAQPATATEQARKALDWSQARRRMKELGVTGFFLDNPPGCGARFTCWILHTATQESERIESTGADEAEAVQLGLDRAAECFAHR